MTRAAESAQSLLAGAERLVSRVEVNEAVTRLASEISAVMADRFPLVLSVMRGSIVFAGQLLPQLGFPLEFDYLDVTRYRGATRGGALEWRIEPGTAVRGRVVLVLDDILDEGRTLAAIREWVIGAGAAAFYSAVLADKDLGREKPVRADFVGVRVPDRYVFGFGMDVGGLWRNLAEIYALDARQPS